LEYYREVFFCLKTNEYGNEIRSDVGLLGQGIYFSDSSVLSIRYTTASQSTNIRLLVVCDVALGDHKDYYDYDTSLVRAPDGFQSVRGVKSTDTVQSKFTENEYVIHDLNQYKLRYLVEFECAPFNEKKEERIIHSKEENNETNFQEGKIRITIIKKIGSKI
jgi:poly [ADP-ribose] polymerase